MGLRVLFSGTLSAAHLTHLPTPLKITLLDVKEEEKLELLSSILIEELEF